MDNQRLRALFALPPIQESSSTSVAVPEMPPQKTVTGDPEVDAVLWLQEVVKTGNQLLIDKAMEAAKRIQTPMETLGKRYGGYVLRRSKGNTMAAVFSSIGFGELESQAKRAIAKRAGKHEALARFGDEATLFSDTPAERACIKALRGVKKPKGAHYYDDFVVAERFSKHLALALTPTSINDCLHAIKYWNEIYRLRSSAADMAGDHSEQATAHEWYCFAMMAQIQPRSADEAMAAFDHMINEDKLDQSDSKSILRNLVRSGWAGIPSGDCK